MLKSQVQAQARPIRGGAPNKSLPKRNFLREVCARHTIPCSNNKPCLCSACWEPGCGSLTRCSILTSLIHNTYRMNRAVDPPRARQRTKQEQALTSTQCTNHSAHYTTHDKQSTRFRTPYTHIHTNTIQEITHIHIRTRTHRMAHAQVQSICIAKVQHRAYTTQPTPHVVPPTDFKEAAMQNHKRTKTDSQCENNTNRYITRLLEEHTLPETYHAQSTTVAQSTVVNSLASLAAEKT